MSGNSLMVIFSELSSFGTYLVQSQTELDDLLKQLDDKMSAINNIWTDSNGSAFSSEFTQFINDSKEINKEIARLGGMAKKIANDYLETVQSYAGHIQV